MRMDSDALHVRRIGSGPPLLLIHGLLMNGDMFEPIIEELAHDNQVLMPDLRGFSRSRHLGPPYSIEQQAQDLARLLDSLSISSAVVLGYSQGGVIAQQLTLDYPECVSHLILCCTFACNRLTLQERIEAMLLPWLVRSLSARQLAKMVKGVMPEQTRQIEAMIESSSKERLVDGVRLMLKFDSRQRLKEINCPTLVLTGAKDSAVPLHHAHMLAQGIPDAQLSIIPNAGHELIWTHGAALIDALNAFLFEV
jgi:pimeloyl-ACP methyl ester carboxylesterase